MADPARAAETCTALRGDGSVIGKFKYRLNGHISTNGNHDFRYGVAAARMKFQKERGQHASFWLQPTGAKPEATTAKEGGAEVDIIEWFGEGGKQSGLTSFIYHPSNKGPVKVGGFLKEQDRFLASKKDSWFKAYHVFSVEWTPKSYVFRIDGRVSATITVGISEVKQYPILSLLSSDYELENLGSESKLPAALVRRLDADLGALTSLTRPRQPPPPSSPRRGRLRCQGTQVPRVGVRRGDAGPSCADLTLPTVVVRWLSSGQQARAAQREVKIGHRTGGLEAFS